MLIGMTLVTSLEAKGSQLGNKYGLARQPRMSYIISRRGNESYASADLKHNTFTYITSWISNTAVNLIIDGSLVYRKP
jgi:hypothetical protein